MVKLFLLFLSLFGRKPKCRGPQPIKIVAAAGSLPAVRPRIRTEAQQVRDAVTILDRFERFHVLGVSRPSAEEAATAWLLLENVLLPLAGFLRVLTHFGRDWPLCPHAADPDSWLTTTLEKIGKEIVEVVTAVRNGASLRAWRAVENVMVRDVEHLLRGCLPVVVYPGGPEARREVHVRDSLRTPEYPEGRVIITKLYEHGHDGRLEIVEPGGGRLSRETLDRSGWAVKDGWIAIAGGGGRARPPRRDDDKPQDENTPPVTSQP